MFASAVCLAQKPELVVRTGHSAGVESVAYSPDGKILASGGRDKTVKLWDVASGQEMLTLSGHSGGVRSVAFSPEGKSLASASDDQTIKLWDVASGQALRTIKGHSRGVRSVAFSPDGRTLASGSEDNTIKLWEVATGRALKTFTLQFEANNYFDYIVPVAFRPDGKALASASWDKTVRVWDLVGGREPKTLQGNPNKAPVATPTPPTPSLAFSPGGDMLASGSSDNTIKLWNVSTEQEIKTLGGGASYFTSVTFSPDGKILAGGTRDNSITLWDSATGRELKTLKAVDKWGWVNSIAFSPDGKTLAGGSDDIRFWDVESARELKPPGRHAHRLNNLVVSPDGKTIASASVNDRTLKLWSLATGRELLTLKGHTEWILSIAFSPDGKVLASGSGYYGGDSEIKLWDVTTGAELRTLKGHSGAVRSVVFSSDGKTLVSGSQDYTIKMWDIANGRVLQTLKGENTIGTPLALSPDGQLVASTTYENEIDVWDVKAGTILRRLPKQRTPLALLAFSPDGRVLAGGTQFYDGRGEIKLWALTTGQEFKTIPMRFPVDRSLVFSPNGETLAGSSRDGDLAFWELTSAIENPMPDRLPDSFLLGLGYKTARADFLAIEDGNRIKLVDAAGKKEIASLIALDESDWAVVTPEGRFDASPSGQKLMHWLVGSERVDLEQLKERYYEPGLLVKIFKGEPLRDVSKFENPKLNPEVKYDSPPKGSGTLVVSLTNRGGGIGRVQVFVNDKEYLADARDGKLKQNPGVNQATLNIDLSSARGTVSGEENQIRVVAWNVENYISSRGEEKAWVAGGPVKKEPPEVYAIVAGISKYSGARLNLQFAGKDAVAMANAIELGAKRLFGADKVHLKLLTTANDPRAVPPTKANFHEAFASAMRQTKPKDILIVYFAGHAITFQQGGQDTYCYLTQEAETTDVSDPEVRKQRTVTSDDLRDWIKQIPANKQAIMLDTCAAGAAQEHFIAAARAGSGDAIRAIELAMDRTGSHFLMGSAADAESFETSQYGQGLLTYALLKGIKGEALDDAGMVDINTLFRFAREEVEKLAKNIDKIQKPKISAAKGDTFPVGRLTREDAEKIVLATQKPMILRPNFQESQTFGDPLDLMKNLREMLRNETATEPGTGEAPFGFSNTEDFPGGIRPVGRYEVEGDKVTVELRLQREKSVVFSGRVVGTKADIASRLIEAIKAALKAL